MHHGQSDIALREGWNAEPSCVEMSFVADRTGDIVALSACTLADLIASREVSCVEVAAAYLDQIGRINPTYNAIVSLRERDDILADAREKDELLARGIRLGWLHGFPLAIKDLAPTKGLRTTLGSPLHRDWVPNRDARFVKQMKQSGAVLIGKTNTAEFGLGSQTFNPVFGTTLNAYDVSRTSGGSSGGAAVALATRMLPVADGSDNAGSIRNPAAYNNIFALRPTQGLMPPEGRDLHLPSFSTIGPMARSVGDLALLLAVQAGDEATATPSMRQSAGCFDARLRGDFKNARIGWLGNLDGYLPFEPGVIDLCERALESFAEIGCHVEPARFEYPLEQLWADWITLRAWLTGGSLVARHADPAKRVLMKAEACFEVEQALRLSAIDVFDASARRSDWCRAMDRLFERYDFLLLPTAQCFPFDAKVRWPREIGGRSMDTYHRWMEVVIYATLAGCPAINTPAGFSAGGLPMGLQIFARPCRDQACLQLAYAYEQVTRWTSIRPLEAVSLGGDINGRACVSQTVWLAALLAVAGACSGVLAGLFGVGGGTVMVPVLYEVFSLYGVPDDVLMPLCVGTSLAVIVPTSISSFIGHYKKGAVDVDVLKVWALPITFGVLGGILAASVARPILFKAVFITVCLFLAIRLLVGKDRWQLGDGMPGPAAMTVYGLLIGSSASLMGIGGGLVANVALTLYRFPIRAVVATASGVGLFVSIPGAIGYVVAGWGHPDLPPLSLGFVSLIGFALLMPLSLLTVGYGVNLAHQLHKRQMEVALALYLMFISLRFAASL